MPADTADLAALDALFQAARCVAWGRRSDATHMDDAEYGAALARLLDRCNDVEAALPALRRRLAIADAAEAWDDAEERFEAVRNAYIFDREGTWEGQRPPLMEAVAARARLRALREQSDAA